MTARLKEHQQFSFFFFFRARLPFALRDFSLHNARFKFPSPRRKIERLFLGIDPPPSLRTALSYTGCARGSGRIWELTSFPPAVDIAIWENWNFTTTPRTIVCALYWERMFHGREIPLSLRWNSFPDIGLNFLARPCLHRTCERNGYPTYAAAPRALLTRFLMHIGRRLVKNKQPPSTPQRNRSRNLIMSLPVLWHWNSTLTLLITYSSYVSGTFIIYRVTFIRRKSNLYFPSWLKSQSSYRTTIASLD